MTDACLVCIIPAITPTAWFACGRLTIAPIIALAASLLLRGGALKTTQEMKCPVHWAGYVSPPSVDHSAPGMAKQDMKKNTCERAFTSKGCAALQRSPQHPLQDIFRISVPPLGKRQGGHSRWPGYLLGKSSWGGATETFGGGNEGTGS